MRIAKIAPLSLILAGLAAFGTSQAQENLDWYLGAGLGDANFDSGVTSVTGTASLDEDDTATKIFAGVSVNPNLSIELQYSDLGEAKLSGNTGDRFNLNGTTFEFTSDNAQISAEAESIGASVLGVLPVTERFQAFGRLGLHTWDATATSTTPEQREELEDDGTDLFFGVGVEIALIHEASLRIEAEQYELDDEDVTSVGGSLLYRF